jgi:CHAT domain-containing protein
MSFLKSFKLSIGDRQIVRRGICSLSCLLLWLSIAPATFAPGWQRDEEYGSQTASQAGQSFATLQFSAPAVSGNGTLAFGESVSHRFSLESQEYLHLTVSQEGLNVSLTLLSPGGSVLLRLNNNDSRYGSERLSWIAKNRGVYILRITANDRQAFGASYALTVDERRLAQRDDNLRLAAQQHLIAASRHAETGRWRLALDALYSSADLWRQVDDRLEQLSVFNKIGDLLLELGDKRKATDVCQRALDLNKSVGDKFEEAISLNNLGEAHIALWEHHVGLDYYQQALLLRRATGDLQGEAATLGNIGLANFYRGDIQAAYNSLQQALALSRENNDYRQEARSLYGLGQVCELLGEYRSALEFSNLALIRYRRLNDRKMEIHGLLEIARLHRSLGDTEKALDMARQAHQLSRQRSDYEGQERSLVDLASVYLQVGQQSFAIKHYERALALSRKTGDRMQAAKILYSMSSVQESAGQYANALNSLNEVLALNRSSGDPRSEATSLYRLAIVLQKQGNLTESLKNIEAAVRITDSLSYDIVSQGLRSAYFSSIREYYELYIDVLMQLDRLHPEKGFAATALHVSERSRAQTLFDLITEASVKPEGVDQNLWERERSLRQRLNAKTAYQMSLLGNKFEQTEAVNVDRDIAQLIVEYQELQASIKQRYPRYALLNQTHLPGLEEIRSELGGSDTLLLEFALGTERSYLWVVSADSFDSYELPPRATIEKAAREVYDLLITRQSSGRTEARILEADSLYQEKAAALSHMLLGPAAGLLGTKRLLFVADGTLHYIPFEALPAPSSLSDSEPRPLVVDHEIVILPSVSVLVSLRRRDAERQPATRSVAVVADPVFERDDPRVRFVSAEFRANSTESRVGGSETDQSAPMFRDFSVGQGLQTLPRLPGASREAKEIMALTRGPQSMAALGFDANRELVMSNLLSSYSIVHIATHGFLNREQPELSGILLSTVDRQGQPENGLLQLHDIYNLNLSADLVVLSACNTGLGKDFKSEGLVGLTQGFMYAGAQSVVASLWRVDDRATTELMARFYEGMMKNGLRPAAALRKAQIEMWQQKRWQAPYYWAGFTLQGDWNRDVVVQRGNSNRTVVRYALGVVALGTILMLFCWLRHNRSSLQQYPPKSVS